LEKFAGEVDPKARKTTFQRLRVCFSQRGASGGRTSGDEMTHDTGYDEQTPKKEYRMGSAHTSTFSKLGREECGEMDIVTMDSTWWKTN